MKDYTEIEGKHYISSKRAAEISSYSKDYIGQLCRGKKIESVMIGRSWYVNEASLLDHKKAAEEAQEARYREYGQRIPASIHQASSQSSPRSLPQPVQVAAPQAPVWTFSDIELPEVAPSAPIVQAAAEPVLAEPILSESELKYSADERPLLPALSKELPRLPETVPSAAAIKSPFAGIKSPFVLGTKSVAVSAFAVAVIAVGAIYSMHASGQITSGMAKAAERVALQTASIGDVLSSISSFLSGIFGSKAEIAEEDDSPRFSYYPYYTGPSVAVSSTTAKTIVSRELQKMSQAAYSAPGPAAMQSNVITVQGVTLAEVDARITAALAPFERWSPTYTFISSQSNSDVLSSGAGTAQSIHTALTDGRTAFSGTSLSVTGAITADTISATNITANGSTNLRVGSNVVLSVDSSGNVIGTSSPSVAAIFATSTTATSTFAGGLTVGTSQFVIEQATGRVGIGTTSPAARLSIAGEGYFTSNVGIGVAPGSRSLSIDQAEAVISLTSTSTGTGGHAMIILDNLGTSNSFSQVRMSNGGTPYFSTGIDPSDSYSYKISNGLNVNINPRLTVTTGGNVGIGTTTPSRTLSVQGSGYISSGLFVGGSITSTSSVASIFPYASTTAFTASGTGYFGAIGIGTTSPTDTLSVAGRALIHGTTTISAADAGITFTGTGVHDITASQGTLRIGSNTIIGNIQAVDETVDIGTPAVRFDKIYATEINATTLVGTIAGGNVSPETLTINSDNATADAENSYLSFERGSVVPNALLTWNSAENAKRFEFNQALFIQNASASTTLTTFDIKGVASQTADILRISNSDDTRLLNFTAGGSLGIGTTSPSRTFSVQGNGLFSGNVAVANLTATSTLTASSTILGVTSLSYGTPTLYAKGFLGGPASSGTSMTNALRIGSTNNIVLDQGITTTGSNAGWIQVRDQSDQSVNYNLLLQQNGGNVGIGTTTPKASLNVYNSTVDPIAGGQALFGTAGAMTSSTGLDATREKVEIGGGTVQSTTAHFGTLVLSTNQTGTSNAVSALYFVNSNLTSSDKRLGSIITSTDGATNSGVMTFNTNSAGTFGEKMRITSGGNVGIGTTSPENQLSVHSTSASETGITIANSDGRGGQINADNQQLYIHGGLSSTAAFRVSSSKIRLGDGGSSNGSIEVGAGSIGYDGNGAGLTFNSLSTASFSAGASTTQITTTGSTYLATTGGNVGIGTTTPAQSLSVQGNTLISGNITSVANITATGTLAFTGAGTITAGTTLGLNSTTGTVNIQGVDGTTALNIKSTDAQNVFNFTPITSDGGGIFNIADGSNATQIRLTSNGNSYINATQGNLGIGTTSPATNLSVTGSGYFTSSVGIGKTPSVALDILASNVGATAQFQNSSASGYEGLDYYNNSGTLVSTFAHSNTSAGVLPSSTWLGTRNAESLHFITNGTSNVRMTIDSSGNVGIGTTSPFAKLSVTGSGTGTGRAFGVADSSNTDRFSVSDDGVVRVHGATGILAIGADTNNSVDSSDSNLNITTNSGSRDIVLDARGSVILKDTSSEIMRVNISGVGIGTTTPSQTLSVQGNLYVSGTAFLGGGYTSTSTITAPNFVANSATATSTFAGGFAVETSGLVYDYSTNNVSIGTAAPVASDKLHVAGSIRSIGDNNYIAISNTSFTNTFQMSYDSNLDADISNNKSSTGDIFISSGGGTRGNGLSILANGNVGIGTTTPNEKLEVTGNIEIDGGRLQLSDANGVNTHFLANEVTAGGLVTASQVGDLILRSGGASGRTLLTSGASIVQMTLLTSGNVGIGTTSPAYPLDVNGDFRVGEAGNLISANAFFVDATAGKISIGKPSPAPQRRIEIGGTQGGQNSGIGFFDAASTLQGTLALNESVGDIQLASTDGIGFFTGSTIGNIATEPTNQRMTITSVGNVGIGTTSPLKLLTVVSSADTYALLSTTNASGDSQINFESSGDNANAWSLGRENSGAFRIQHSTGPSSGMGTLTTRMFIDTSGNVGIGTTTAAARLSIDTGTASTKLRLSNTSMSADLNAESDTLTIEGSGLNTFRVSTGNAEGMRLNSSGFLGIGDSSPDAYLEISASSNGLNDLLYVSSDDGNEGDRFIIKNGGNVGIGTTSPWGKLAVTNTGTSPSFIVEDATSPDSTPFIINSDGTTGIGVANVGKKRDGTTSIDTGSAQLHVMAPNSNFGPALMIHSDSLGRTTRLVSPDETKVYQVDATDSSMILGLTSIGNQLVLATGGNVGIGTTTPANNLTVNSTGDTAISITGGDRRAELFLQSDYDNNGTANSHAAIRFNVSGGDQWWSAGVDNADSNKFKIGYASDFSSNALTINTSGNVGIGTTSPMAKLDIVGADNAFTLTLKDFLTDGVNKDAFIGMGHYTNAEEAIHLISGRSDSADNTVYIGGNNTVSSIGNAATNIRFLTAANNTTLGGTERMRIDSNGNVGIGTTSPSGVLAVTNAGSGFTAYIEDASSDTTPFVINNSGIVGIGIANPASTKLQVAEDDGNFYQLFSNLAGTARLSIGSDTSGNPQIRARNNLSLQLADDSGNGINVLDGGNVGIGTTSPAQEFSVSGDGYFTGNVGIGVSPSYPLHILGTSGNRFATFNSPTLGGYMTFETAGTAYADVGSKAGLAGSGSETNTLVIQGRSGNGIALGANGSEVIRIASTGNVGIGTTSPVVSLEVAKSQDAGTNIYVTNPNTGSSASAGLLLTNESTGLGNAFGQLVMLGAGYSSSGIRTASSTWLNASGGDLTIGTRSGGRPIIFHTGGIAAANERMRIDGNGNVGIGTSSSTHKLEIGGFSSSDTSSALRIGISGWGSVVNPMVYFDGGPSSDGNILKLRSMGVRTDTEIFEIENSAGTAFVVKGNGNVGIGTTSPWGKLSITNTDASAPSFIVEDDTSPDSTPFMISETGNVGIGKVSNSNFKLDIGLSNATGDYLKVGDAAYGLFLAGDNNSTSGSGYVGNFRYNITTPGSSITASGNTTADGMYFDNGTHFFSNSGISGAFTPAERMTILNSGNVGIGTTSPSSLLSVAGNVYSTGKIGIGIVPASIPLEVYGANAEAIRISGGGTGALSTRFVSTGADTYFGVESSSAGGFFTGSSAYSTVIYSGTAIQNIIGGTARMTINTSGNVGIGTTSPTSLLSLYGTPTITAATSDGADNQRLILVGGGAASNDRGGNISLVGNEFSTSNQYGDVRIGLGNGDGASNKGDFILSSDASSAILVGTNAGNVGIGTTTPGTKLTVAGSAASIATFDTTNATGGYVRFQYGSLNNGLIGNGSQVMSSGNLADFAISTYSTSGNLVLGTDAGTARMTIQTSTGNVGIGTSTPDYGLDIDVNAAAKLRLSNNANYDSANYQIFTSNGGRFFVGQDSSIGTGINSTALPFAGSLMTESAYPLAFGTNNTTRMVINSSGNVGIGTTSPNTALEILGSNPTLRLDSTSGTVNEGAILSFAYNSNNNYKEYATIQARLSDNTTASEDAHLSFQTIAAGTLAERMRITNTGNVGIGSSSPFSNLTVNGDDMWVGDGGSFYFRAQTGSSNTTALRFLVGTLASTEVMTIGGAGNVGIGTTSPVSTLSLRANSPALLIQGTDGSTVTDPSIYFSRYGTGDMTKVGAAIRYEYRSVSGGLQEAGHLTFMTTNNVGDSVSEKMRITGAGNVGIGTTTHAALGYYGTTDFKTLSIKSSTGNRASVIQLIGNSAQAGGGNGFGRLSFVDDASYAEAAGIGAYLTNTGTNDGNLHFDTNGATAMTINSSGNVGIGTTSPRGLLEIATGSAAGTPASNGDLFIIDTGAGAASDGMSILSGTTGQGNILFGDSGDNDIGFLTYTHNGDYMRLGTNAGERVRIDSSGNIGIGTTSPSSLLHLDGGSTVANLTIEGHNTGTSGNSLAFSRARGSIASPTSLAAGDFVGSITSNAFVGGAYSNAGRIDFKVTSVGASTANTDIIFSPSNAGNTEAMRIISTGNVGIGTTTPAKKLDIYTTTNTDGISITGSNANTSLIMKSVASNGRAFSFAVSGGGHSDGDGKLFLFPNDTFAAGSQALTVVGSTGYIGIGTTSPQDILHVAGGSSNGFTVEGSSNPTMKFYETSSGDGNIVGDMRWDAWDSGGAVQEYGRIRMLATSDNAGAEAGELRLRLADGAGSFIENMVFKGTGNVGIGTTSPSGPLHVSGGTRTLNLDYTGVAGGFVYQSFRYLAGEKWWIRSDTSTDELTFQSRAGTAANVMTLLQSGNVGIGTTTPGAELNIAGTSYTELLLSDSDASANVKHYGLSTDSGKFYIRRLTDGLSGYDPSLTIDQGNVGIGTTSPMSQLSVGIDSNSSAATFAISNKDTAGGGTPTGRTLEIKAYGGGLNGAELSKNTAASIVIKSVDSPINILTTQSTDEISLGTANTEVIRITGGGNVGIGSTTPSKALSIAGSVLVGAGAGQSAIHIRNTGTALSFNRDADSGVIFNSGAHAYQWQRTESTTATSDYLALQVYNASGSAVTSSALVINGSGNVGIGTTSPGTRLDVSQGTINSTYGVASFTNTMTGDGNVNFLLVGKGAATGQSALYGYRYDTTSGDEAAVMGVWGDDVGIGTGITIKKGGNVGIGTTTPGTKLEVFNNAGGEVFRFDSGSGSGTYGSFSNNTTQFGYVGSAGSLMSGGSATDMAIRAQNNLQLSAGGSGIDMTITSAGNVGIGTTTPSGKLSVTAADAYGQDVIISNAAGEAPTLGFNAGANGDFTMGYRSATGNFVIANANNVGASERFVIDSSGEIGIGTTDPQDKLHINGGVIIEGTQQSDSDSDYPVSGKDIFELFGKRKTDGSTNLGGFGMMYEAGYESPIIYGYDAGSNNGGSIVFGSMTAADRNLGTGLTPRMVINNYTGNVGIGTSSPGYKLDVAGTVAFPALPNGAGTAYVCLTLGTGQISTSTGTCTASSLRFKDNVENLSYGLSDIMALRPVSFTYKPDMLVPGNQLGFIAEEVDGVIPELVGHDSEGLAASVDYAKLAPVLVNAIQQMQIVVSTENAGTTTTAIYINSDSDVGIGTTSPEYKLHIIGDVAATSFVNISTREAKTNISYLDDAAKDSILDKIKDIGVARYRYSSEDSSNPLRLGLIAEEAPADILAAGGKGVDVYKLSTFTLAGVQEQQKHIETLDLSVASSTITIFDLIGLTRAQGEQITAIQSQLAVLTGRVDKIASSTETIATAIDNLKAQVTALNAAVSQNASSASVSIASTSAVADELASSTPFIERLASAVGSVFTKKLFLVERLEAKTVAVTQGFDITDQATGVVWCVTVKNGEWSKVPWACGTPATAVAAAAQSTQPITTPINTQSTANVIQENQPAPTPVPTPTPTPTPTPEPVATTTVTTVTTDTTATTTATTATTTATTTEEPVVEVPSVATSTPAISSPDMSVTATSTPAVTVEEASPEVAPSTATTTTP